MRHVDTVIIGGGQAGLALSRSLGERGVEHVVLERGRIAERWRSERWDSLHLLTPRWQARLPGWSYRGPDPDGYMSRGELVDYLERYAASFSAPLEDGTEVLSVVRRGHDGYRVDTDRGVWRCSSVVVATGHADVPSVPDFAADLPAAIHQVVPTRYRTPGRLPEGGVLVVGASATGIQLAEEIHASGRPVTLAVSRHTRLPRTYRGQDILWWFDRMGILDQRATEVRDLRRSMDQPSLQLVGSPERRTLDLGVLAARGVRIVGRAEGVDGYRIGFGDDLQRTVDAADAKLTRLLLRVDRFARTLAPGDVTPTSDFTRRIHLPASPAGLDLRAEGIRTVVWATGFRRRYPWLRVPVLGRDGEIRHRGGLTPSPGLYVLGLRFLRRRNSSFIDGQARDAEEIACHILARRLRRRAA